MIRLGGLNLGGSPRLLWLIRVVTIATTVAAIAMVYQFDSERERAQSRSEVAERLTAKAILLETTIKRSIQTARSLVAVISTEPDLDQQRFSALGNALLVSIPEIRALGASPSMRVSLLHPLKDNQAALGLKLDSNFSRWPAANKAARTGQVTLDGPMELVQGGRGLIGWLPVAVREGDETRFWGLVSVVIDEQKLYRAAGLLDDGGLQLALRYRQGSDGGSQVIFGEASLFTKDPVLASVSVPDGQIQLAGLPKNGWPGFEDELRDLALSSLLGLTLVILPVMLLTFSMRREWLSRRQLETLFDVAPTGMILAESDSGRIVEVNDRFLRMSGFDMSTLQDMSLEDLVMPDKRAQLTRLRVESRDGTQFGPYESELLTRTGQPLTVSCSGSVLRSTDRQLLMWTLVQDISERKRVENVKAQFVSTVSHELRTPLTSIAGSLGLLCRGAVEPSTDKGRELLSIAMFNSERCTRLVNELLDLDQLTSRTMRLNIRPVSIVELVRDSIQAQELVAAQYGISVNLVGDSADMTLPCDPDRVRQILGNLLSHALNHSVKGQVVEVAVLNLEDKFRIRVQDHGPPLEEDRRARMFDVFADQDVGPKRLKGGTGLGLAVSRQLARLMGGDIHFESDSAQGNRFYLTFPRLDGDTVSSH